MLIESQEKGAVNVILGLKRGEIKLVNPQKGWVKEFQRTQKEIHETTKIISNRIEHIGSTSIIGIQAKPMIDIAIGVDDINHVPPNIYNQLQEIGFYRLRIELEDEIVLARFTDKTFNVKTHIIHMVNYQGEKWNDLLDFRDKLNASKTLRERYESIKLSYIQNENGDMNDYTNYKERFVLSVLEED